MPKPVSRDEVIAILEVAARAPSGTNMQPWKVYVVGKPKIDAIYETIMDSGIKPERAVWDDYQYYPKRFVEPYLARRRDLGAALYSLLGIEKRDVQKMREQFNRNFKFFDAPIGLFVTIDRRLEVGSWLDLGMFIQNILIAAQGRGISTCPQAAFAPFHKQIRPLVDIPDEEILVCGIALGYEDKEKIENGLRTLRAPTGTWVKEIFLMSVSREETNIYDELSDLNEAVASLIDVSKIPHIRRHEKMHGTVSAMHEICRCLSSLDDISRPEVTDALLPARELHARSPFVKRLQDWPRGYAGDFETIEYLMKAKPQIPECDDAFWIEWYALNTPIAYQHRNKLLFQRDSCIAASRGGECRVMSVGCGGAYDLNMLRNHNGTKFHITLIDIENDAVELAVQRLSWAETVNPLVGDAVRKIRATKESFDIIIFGGLFDYLSDRAITIILKSSYGKLADGGRLIFTNISNFSTFDVWLEHLAKWEMTYRSETDLIGLVESAGIDPRLLSIEPDATGLTFLCTVNKE